MDIDATACYDRIILNLASLVSRLAGLPGPVTKACADTLQEAGFRLLTLLGVSEEFYQHCKNHPIYGSGQGSGNSPAFWLLISSIILRTHKERAHGAEYASPYQNNTIDMAMAGFVDDTTARVNAMLEDFGPEEAPPELVKRLQEDTQHWNDLLDATGGALNLSKCSYQLAVYKFAKSGAPVLSTYSHEPIKLFSRDDPQGVAIKYLGPGAAHKTLGYHKSMSGNNAPQVQALLNKSLDHKNLVLRSSLTPAAAHKYYFSVYAKSVGYTTRLTTLTKAEWNSIQSPFLLAILPRMGLNRNHPRAALFAPKRMGGYGMVDFAILQGASAIAYFLEHWREPKTPIGQLLRIVLDWAQLAAGVSWPILEYPDRKLPHLEAQC